MGSDVNESRLLNDFPLKLKNSGIHPFNLKVSGILGKMSVLEFETRCNTNEDLGKLNQNLLELQKKENVPVKEINNPIVQSKKKDKDLFSSSLRWNSKELFKN